MEDDEDYIIGLLVTRLRPPPRGKIIVISNPGPDTWIKRRFLEEDKSMPKYQIDEATLKSLENSYTYHPPKDDQPERYVLIRDKAKEFATLICENAPPSRERSIALTDLEKVVTMVNKAIACNE